MDDFEIVVDDKTGETVLRLRADVAQRKGLTDLSQTNFEVVTDPTTGQTMIRIKNDETNGRVEIVTDAITGKQTIRLVRDDDENDQSNETKLNFY